MKDEFGVVRISPRGLIRYLGLTVGIVAGAPSVMGCLYYLINFSEIGEESSGAAFCFVLGPLIAFATYRWMMIGGEASEQVIALRGWWGSSTVLPDQLASIRRVETQVNSKRSWYYGLFDHGGREIGHVPSMLMACENWDRFLQHMQQLAADSRNRRGESPSENKRRPAGKPLDDLTADDLERYEHEK